MVIPPELLIAGIGVSSNLINTFVTVWSAHQKKHTENTPPEQIVKEFVDTGYAIAAQKYEDAMLKRYGSMRILGMAKPISLEGIYTQVNVLSKPSAFAYCTEEHQEQLIKMYRGVGSYGDTVGEGISGIKAVADNDKLFILGKPGAGKTTFCKWMTLQTIKGTIDQVPIFIPLNHYADSGLSLFEYVVNEFEICNFPGAKDFLQTILKEGKCIIFCDGLDEVKNEGGVRSKVIKELTDFSDQYRSNSFIITCRVAAHEYSFERFTYVEMSDFDEGQIKEFVKGWFIKKPKKHEKFITDFNKSENSGLRDLAKSPLLLTLLCLSFNETMKFSHRRSEIYKKAFYTMLEKWDASREITRDDIYRNLSNDYKENMFVDVAAKSFSEGNYLFKQDDLRDDIVTFLKTLPKSEADDAVSRDDGHVVLKAVAASMAFL